MTVDLTVRAWVKSPGNDRLLSQAADLWNERLAQLQQTTACPRLFDRVKSRAGRELRELQRVRYDDGRKTIPNRKCAVREQMAWLSTFDARGELVAKGVGLAWLKWYRTLINRIVRACAREPDNKRPLGHRPHSNSELRSSLGDELVAEWERYRKLATRTAATPQAEPKRRRGPSLQVRALRRWEASNPLYAVVLATFITPQLKKSPQADLELPERFSAFALLEDALQSFRESVPKAAKLGDTALSVHKLPVLSRARNSATRKVAQGSNSDVHQKGTKKTCKTKGTGLKKTAA